jgi:ABC-type sugar transport system ATPase subunit
MNASPVLLRLDGVEKYFGETAALAGVTVELRTGEVRCLMGSNGSGKSTLAKIITGFHRPDAGRAYVRGTEVGWPLPMGGSAAGLAIAAVHQDRALAPGLPVHENLFLPRPLLRPGGLGVDRAGERRQGRRLLEDFGVAIDVKATVGELSPAEQAIVEIVRAVKTLRDRPADAHGLLLLDEPTAALSARDSAKVLDVIRQLSGEDIAVVFVTHRMDEAFEVGTHYTVLRNGQVVADGLMEEVDGSRLITLMVGEPSDAIDTAEAGEAGGDDGAPVLAVEGLIGAGVRDVSFVVRRGEILGMTGLTGAGHEEVLEIVFGARRPVAGSIIVDGRPVRPTSPRAGLAAGIAYLAPDRRRRGFVAEATIRENLTLPFVRRFTRGGHLGRGEERRLVRDRLSTLKVVGGSNESPIGLLSGGNQQKVLLGRWLELGPAVYLLANPTEGVDVGTRLAMYSVFKQLAGEGRGVVVATGDFEELATVCDRVLVFGGGRVVAELQREQVTRQRLVRVVEQPETGRSGPADHHQVVAS